MQWLRKWTSSKGNFNFNQSKHAMTFTISRLKLKKYYVNLGAKDFDFETEKSKPNWDFPLEDYIRNVTFDKPQNKQVYILDTFQIIDYNRKHQNSLKIINERILGFYEGFCTNQMLLTEPYIQNIMIYLQQSGIVDRIMGNFIEFDKFNPPEEAEEPKALSLTSTGICSSFLALACCVHS